MNKITNETKKIGNEKILRYVYLSVLLILVAIFYLVYFYNTYPITEGWGIYYAELLKSGNVPYRDFYYYLPPLNLFIDYILWQCSFGFLIIYRFYRLLERLLMLALIYLLLCKFFKYKYVFIATLFSAFIAVKDVYDLMGDYNQTSELLIVVITFFAVNFVTSDSNKKKYLYGGIIGAVLGLLLMLKQSTAVATMIAFLVFFIVYSISNKNKKWYIDGLYVGLGFITTTVPFIIYILAQGAFDDFIVQVFLGGSSSKGGLKSILIDSIISRLFNNMTLVVVYFVAGIAWWLYLNKKNNHNKKINKIIWLVYGIVGFFFVLMSLVFSENIRLFLQRYYLDLILLVVVAIIYYFLVKYIFRDSIKQNVSILILILSSFVISYILLYNNVGGIIYKYSTDSITYIINRITECVFIFTLICLVGGYILSIKCFNVKYLNYLVLFTGAFASLYATSMTCGNSEQASRSLFFSLPFILTCIFCLGKGNFKFIKNAIIICVCAILCLGVFSHKFTNAYLWWGCNEAPYSSKTEYTNIKALKGIKFSKEQKEMYERVCKLINENTDENAVVYGFPHIKIFNILTNRIGENGFVPVPFYDVSDGEAVAKDAELLAQNNPDIVIWCDIPYCLEVHETVFNGGQQLKHREIFKWFKKASQENYTLIGQVGNLFVYLKNNGNPPVNPYFEDPNRENSTLQNFVV